MSYTKFIISFILLSCSIIHIFGKPQRRPLPFPHLTDFNMSDIGKPVHIFEGIDYDQLPDNLKDEYNDCYSEHYKCIRLRTHHNPVCGFDERHKRFRQYYSQCELNLRNCHEMVKAGRGIYGKTNTDGIIFYMGEGYECQHYVRSYEGKEISTHERNNSLMKKSNHSFP